MVNVGRNQVAHRLSTVTVSPTLQSSLLEMVEQDNLLGPQNWSAVIPTISGALGATDAQLVQPFALAWGALNAGLRRLDHVQDGDPSPFPLPTVPAVGAHYNLLLSYYLLATTLLDDLDGNHIPASRLLRLRKWWGDCLLRVASGQQADLELFQDKHENVAMLNEYQHIVQAKTGALFALAFGGTAMLLTDDAETIVTLSEVGEVYGMLVQYGDDVLDANEQVNPTVTLPRAYAAAYQAQKQVPVVSMHTFWNRIYTAYVQQVEHALATLGAPVSIIVRQLFTDTFESNP